MSIFLAFGIPALNCVKDINLEGIPFKVKTGIPDTFCRTYFLTIKFTNCCFDAVRIKKFTLNSDQRTAFLIHIVKNFLYVFRSFRDSILHMKTHKQISSAYQIEICFPFEVCVCAFT